MRSNCLMSGVTRQISVDGEKDLSMFALATAEAEDGKMERCLPPAENLEQTGSL